MKSQKNDTLRIWQPLIVDWWNPIWGMIGGNLQGVGLSFVSKKLNKLNIFVRHIAIFFIAFVLGSLLSTSQPIPQPGLRMKVADRSVNLPFSGQVFRKLDIEPDSPQMMMFKAGYVDGKGNIAHDYIHFKKGDDTFIARGRIHEGGQDFTINKLTRYRENKGTYLDDLSLKDWATTKISDLPELASTLNHEFKTNGYTRGFMKPEQKEQKNTHKVEYKPKAYIEDEKRVVFHDSKTNQRVTLDINKETSHAPSNDVDLIKRTVLLEGKEVRGIAMHQKLQVQVDKDGIVQQINGLKGHDSENSDGNLYFQFMNRDEKHTLKLGEDSKGGHLKWTKTLENGDKEVRKLYDEKKVDDLMDTLRSKDKNRFLALEEAFQGIEPTLKQSRFQEVDDSLPVTESKSNSANLQNPIRKLIKGQDASREMGESADPVSTSSQRHVSGNSETESRMKIVDATDHSQHASEKSNKFESSSVAENDASMDQSLVAKQFSVAPEQDKDSHPTQGIRPVLEPRNVPEFPSQSTQETATSDHSLKRNRDSSVTAALLHNPESAILEPMHGLASSKAGSSQSHSLSNSRAQREQSGSLRKDGDSMEQGVNGVKASVSIDNKKSVTIGAGIDSVSQTEIKSASEKGTLSGANEQSAKDLSDIDAVTPSFEKKNTVTQSNDPAVPQTDVASGNSQTNTDSLSPEESQNGLPENSIPSTAPKSKGNMASEANSGEEDHLDSEAISGEEDNLDSEENTDLDTASRPFIPNKNTKSNIVIEKNSDVGEGVADPQQMDEIMQSPEVKTANDAKIRHPEADSSFVAGVHEASKSEDISADAKRTELTSKENTLAPQRIDTVAMHIKQPSTRISDSKPDSVMIRKEDGGSETISAVNARKKLQSRDSQSDPASLAAVKVQNPDDSGQVHDISPNARVGTDSETTASHTGQKELAKSKLQSSSLQSQSTQSKQMNLVDEPKRNGISPETRKKLLAGGIAAGAAGVILSGIGLGLALQGGSSSQNADSNSNQISSSSSTTSSTSSSIDF